MTKYCEGGREERSKGGGEEGRGEVEGGEGSRREGREGREERGGNREPGKAMNRQADR